MITIGELEFLKRMCYTNSQIDQCSYVQGHDYVERCQNFLDDPLRNENMNVRQRAALWHGGGNWGDIWRTAQTPRITSLSDLLSRNYTVISMPQSLHYNNSDIEQEDATWIQERIAFGLGLTSEWSGNAAYELSTKRGKMMARSQVIFTWREVESYQRATQLYPFATNLLVPDIAFQLGPYERLPATATFNGKYTNYQYDIVILMRDDKESLLGRDRSAGRVQELLFGIAGGSHVTFTIVDWGSRLSLFQSKDVFFTRTSIQLISMGRIVVCDRLHASILAYLTGMPFVFIDQFTGKISKTLNVALGLEDGCADGGVAKWARARDLKHALQLATRFVVQGSFGRA